MLYFNRSLWKSLVLLALLSGGAAAQEANRFETAMRLLEEGSFERAVAMLRDVRDDPKQAADRVRANLAIADASRRLGLYQEAAQALANIAPDRNESDRSLRGRKPEIQNAHWIAQYYRQLGNLQIATHRHEESLSSFTTALSKAAEAGDDVLRASLFSEYGNALAIGGYSSDALAAYLQSQNLARAKNLTAMQASVTLNLARLQFDQGAIDESRASLVEALSLLNGLQPSYEWALMQLAAADLERNSAPAAANASQDIVRARLQRLQQVDAYAKSVGNVRLRSSANGGQSRDWQQLNELQAAEESVRRAIFFASQSQASDLLYQWRWQLATLQRQAGNLDAAIASFEQAVATLTPIRQELLSGYHNSQTFFRQRVRPVYLEYVDALFTRAGTVDEQRPVLERARDVLESLASAELQDYFRDQCVIDQQRNAMTLEQVPPNSAVLYPIVLDDRVELLLSVSGRLHRHTVMLESRQLQDAAVNLREFIQDPASTRYLPYSQRLYRWLIEPVKAQIITGNADTLVLVPDGVLRTIPFAALHSGERFLVEEFAVAVTPGIKLTAASKPRAEQLPALLTGVGQPVQGFAPLPNVSAELAAIREHVGGTVLSDREYTKANLQAALAADNYGIVHMATHSMVGAKSADSFLLTYDGKLSMGDLEQLLRIGKFRDSSIELLTLSACETAVGDERAALGLAGIAVKSGAKSVVASLWLVEDESTATLMNRFYRNLSMRNDVGRSKAKALRASQLNLLADPSTEHPAHWAAFTLIGNWQ